MLSVNYVLQKNIEYECSLYEENVRNYIKYNKKHEKEEKIICGFPIIIINKQYHINIYNIYFVIHEKSFM